MTQVVRQVARYANVATPASSANQAHAGPARIESSASAATPERGRVRYAGAHLLIDLYGASALDDIEAIERCLVKCVEAAGATLLHIHLHPFEPNGGVSGVAVLAESHLSIHTWPEHAYGAVDVFMCGKARPERCVDVLRDTFRPQRLVVEEIMRGSLR